MNTGQTCQVSVLHGTVEGRARFHVAGLYRSEKLAAALRARLLDEQGILRVSASPLTGNVLVSYEPDQLTQAKVRALINQIRRAPLKAKPRALGTGPRWHLITASEALTALGSGATGGLSEKEAVVRLRRHGRNALRAAEQRSELEIYLGQFNNLPSALLLGSTALSLATGGVADAVAILAVVVLNSYIGYRTENSAERAISALTTPPEPKATVVRGARLRTIAVAEVVPGDILVLKPGTYVAADGRLIAVEHLSVNESMLTGESLPVSKSESRLTEARPPLAELRNMVFRGTVVTGGSALAVVTASGEKTEAGKIQKLMGESRAPETPLQRQLRYLGKRMALLSLSVSGATLVVGLLRGYRALEMLKTAVSLAVAAVPESLPTIATTTLARGIRNMSGKGLLVRRLDAVETLGSVDVVCFDKTGTLTMNQMSVVEVATSARRFDLSGGAHPRHRDLLRLARIAALCNEAAYVRSKGTRVLEGSATEAALVRLAEGLGVNVERLRVARPARKTFYRTASRSYMTTVHEGSGKGRLYAVKGRPDDVLKLCGRYLHEGKVRGLRARDRAAIEKENRRMARQGLRVLGVAYRLGKPRGLTWLGLVGMRDPIRDGADKAIRNLQRAQIRTVMITGDQALTAEAIGRKLRFGRGRARPAVLDSRLVESATPAELSRLLAGTDVIARVNPAHKLQIVQALQRSGKVIAMVGDGINDGPALKAADVGIAMGAGGTEVVSQVADIVLKADELARLRFAVKEGRTVQEDIKKAVDYILTQNLAEVLFTFLSIALGLGEPLSPMQLLWMNLLTDIFPELALAQEPGEKDILTRASLHPEEKFFSGGDLRRMGFESSVLTAASLATYAFALRRYPMGNRARTVGFTTLVSSSLLYTLSARSERYTIFDSRGQKRNVYIPLAMGIGFGAELAGIFLPWVARSLGTTRVGALDLFVSGLGSLVPLLCIETTKFLHGVARDEEHAA